MMKTIKYSISSALLLATALAPGFSAYAAYSPVFQMPSLGPETMVCHGLSVVGIGCTTSGISVGDYQPKPVRLSFDVFGSSAFADNTTNTSAADSKAAITNAIAPKDLNGQKINIVSVPSSPEIYELVNGEKHPFPSLAIYYDYGYTLSMIQPITQDQLDKYSRANLVKVKGDSKIYYLTENGMVRQIVDPKKIFNFYGDRPEDIITISRKEFNYYPTNSYIYQFSPLNRDVFQVSAAGKRYLTPMALARLGIRADQVAPVSQSELNSYKMLAPVID